MKIYLFDTIQKITVYFFIFIIYIYKIFLSPFLGKNCNFHPTCSSYAILSLKKHGIFKGIWKSLNRIYRCNPRCKEFKHEEP